MSGVEEIGARALWPSINRRAGDLFLVGTSRQLAPGYTLIGFDCNGRPGITNRRVRTRRLVVMINVAGGRLFALADGLIAGCSWLRAEKRKTQRRPVGLARAEQLERENNDK